MASRGADAAAAGERGDEPALPLLRPAGAAVALERDRHEGDVGLRLDSRGAGRWRGGRHRVEAKAEGEAGGESWLAHPNIITYLGTCRTGKSSASVRCARRLG